MTRPIMAAVDDLFFAAKIRGTAEAVGARVEFVRGADALVERAKSELPRLIIVDLHAKYTDPFVLAEHLKADETLRAIPVLGFFSHVQTELLHRARSSGFDHILARSMFTKQLPSIVRGDL